MRLIAKGIYAGRCALHKFKAPLPGVIAGTGAFCNFEKNISWEEEIKKPRKEKYSKVLLVRAVLPSRLRSQRQRRLLLLKRTNKFRLAF